MVIRFECGHCHKKLGIADTEAGKMIKCPGCGGKVRIPSQSAVTGPPAAPAKKPAAPAAKPPPVPAPKPAPPKPAPPKRSRPQEDLVEVDPIDEAPPPRAAKARPAPRRRDEDEEEDEEPRRRSRRAKSRRYEDEEDEDEDFDEDEEEDEEDEERGVFTPDRIRGIVSIVFGGVVLAFGLFFPRLQEGDPMGDGVKWGVIGLAGVMFAAGIFYLVKG